MHPVRDDLLEQALNEHRGKACSLPGACGGWIDGGGTRQRGQGEGSARDQAGKKTHSVKITYLLKAKTLVIAVPN